MERFTAIVDHPTDNNIIDIQQLLMPILMKTKYGELTLTHNLSGVIIPTERYEHIYKKGAYLIPPVIELYDDTIEKNTTRTEVHRAKGKHEAKKNYRALYETSDTLCKNFIMEVVDETWYKELEEPDMFLHRRHGPQTLRPSHQVLFGTTHRGCGGYSSSDENPLQRR